MADEDDEGPVAVSQMSQEAEPAAFEPPSALPEAEATEPSGEPPGEESLHAHALGGSGRSRVSALARVDAVTNAKSASASASGKSKSKSCHRCSWVAVLGGSSRTSTAGAQCGVCGTVYHLHDCGNRFASAGLDPAGASVCPKCNEFCECEGGPVYCYAAARRERAQLKRRALESEGLIGKATKGIDDQDGPNVQPRMPSGPLAATLQAAADMAKAGIGGFACGPMATPAPPATPLVATQAPLLLAAVDAAGVAAPCAVAPPPPFMAPSMTASTAATAAGLLQVERARAALAAARRQQQESLHRLCAAQQEIQSWGALLARIGAVHNGNSNGGAAPRLAAALGAPLPVAASAAQSHATQLQLLALQAALAPGAASSQAQAQAQLQQTLQQLLTARQHPAAAAAAAAMAPAPPPNDVAVAPTRSQDTAPPPASPTPPAAPLPSAAAHVQSAHPALGGNAMPSAQLKQLAETMMMLSRQTKE